MREGRKLGRERVALEAWKGLCWKGEAALEACREGGGRVILEE